MTRTIHIGYFPWQIHFPSSHYSIIKHGFSYSTKRLPVRAFTIRGPLWSSSIFTSYQPWKNNNESYLHETLLGPLPKPLCYGSFFKGWHQWQRTLINKRDSLAISCDLSEVHSCNHTCSGYSHEHVKTRQFKFICENSNLQGLHRGGRLFGDRNWHMYLLSFVWQCETIVLYWELLD